MDRRIYFDQALRDVQAVYKATPWDAARTLGELLAHVWIEKHDPQVCTTCAKAEAYATVWTGALRADDEGS